MSVVRGRAGNVRRSPLRSYALQHWGRTGTSGQSNVDGPFDDATDATKIFGQKFKEKTGQDWGSYATEKGAVRVTSSLLDPTGGFRRKRSSARKLGRAGTGAAGPEAAHVVSDKP